MMPQWHCHQRGGLPVSEHRESKLKAGTVWVNCYNVFDSALPFGGYKSSGIGRQNGYAGFDQYLEVKSLAWPVEG